MGRLADNNSKFPKHACELYQPKRKLCNKVSDLTVRFVMSILPSYDLVPAEQSALDGQRRAAGRGGVDAQHSAWPAKVN